MAGLETQNKSSFPLCLLHYSSLFSTRHISALHWVVANNTCNRLSVVEEPGFQGQDKRRGTLSHKYLPQFNWGKSFFRSHSPIMQEYKLSTLETRVQYNSCANNTLGFSKHSFSGLAFLNRQPLVSILCISSFPVEAVILSHSLTKKVGRKHVLGQARMSTICISVSKREASNLPSPFRAFYESPCLKLYKSYFEHLLCDKISFHLNPCTDPICSLQLQFTDEKTRGLKYIR